MDEETKKVLEELFGPPDLIEQFIGLLKARDVSIEKHEHGIRTKYFLATKVDRSVVVLAHESTKDGWWGIGADLISRVNKVAEDPKFGLGSWGAALIDQKPSRGYWVPGEAISELHGIGLVTLDSQGKYHFHRPILEAQTELVHSFASIEKFLKLAGLES